LNPLSLFAAHCQAALDRSGSLIPALFLLGLVGSASHCAGMCGPFVLAQVGARSKAATEPGLRRLAGLALLPYHVGRASTYVALGTLLAAPIGLMAELPRLRWIPAAMLLLAACLFLVQALRSWGIIGRTVPRPSGLGFWRFAGDLFARPIGLRGYALGVILGFLPCGLLYSALVAAAATADPLAAAFGMFGFVLGTVPMLVAIGLLGQGAASRWRSLARQALPLVSTLNALVLLIMAWRLAGFT
jgi:sulfite exporter TauE/SafE